MYSETDDMVQTVTNTSTPYDALLLCSFGGPNSYDDVIPFLQNVTRGKNIPEQRLREVGAHYYGFGGKSPINEQNLALRAALRDEAQARGLELPVLWGNRNWHPYTVDTLRDAAAFGAKRVLALVTSAYASYSGSRQYREHLAAARADLGDDAPEIDVLRPFFNDPGFIAANTASIREALESLQGGHSGAHILYVTHSIPETMQAASAVTGPGYLAQHEDVRRTIDDKLAVLFHEHFSSSLAYCSRSGDPRVPWLEPDVNRRLEQLVGEGVSKIVIAPIGFISDHMEVAYDLDVEAMQTAADHGVVAVRAATAGVRPEFVSGIVDMVLERAARERGEEVLASTVGELEPLPDIAPPDSCRMRHGEVTGVPVLAGERD